MLIIFFSISVVSFIIFLLNTASVFIFASIIIERLYISKRFNKKEHFDLYNDLFSWIGFFISIGIINVIEIILSLIVLNYVFAYFLFKIIILIMLSAFFVKIFHVEKVMRVITYEKHYYMGIIQFPIILIILIVNIPIVVLILIFVCGSLIPFLVFFSILRNSETSIKNSLKTCLGATFFGVGCILTSVYVLNFMQLTEFFNILFNILYIGTPILFSIGSFLIYDSIRRNL